MVFPLQSNEVYTFLFKLNISMSPLTKYSSAESITRIYHDSD